MTLEHLLQIDPSSVVVDTFASSHPLSDNWCAVSGYLIDLSVLGSNSLF